MLRHFKFLTLGAASSIRAYKYWFYEEVKRVPLFWISRHLDDGAKAYSILILLYILNGHVLGLGCSNTSYVNNVDTRVDSRDQQTSNIPI